MYKKNDFMLICDKLEKCNKSCNGNGIICAKRYLREYACGDVNKLLKIKAEALTVAKSADMINITVFLITAMSFVIAILGNQIGCLRDLYGNFLLLVLTLWLIYLHCIFEKKKITKKWEIYILIVIDEMIDEIS